MLRKSLEVDALEILNVLFPTPPIAEHRQNVAPILALFPVEKFSDGIAKMAFRQSDDGYGNCWRF